MLIKQQIQIEDKKKKKTKNLPAHFPSFLGLML